MATSVIDNLRGREEAVAKREEALAIREAELEERLREYEARKGLMIDQLVQIYNFTESIDQAVKGVYSLRSKLKAIKAMQTEAAPPEGHVLVADNQGPHAPVIPS